MRLVQVTIPHGKRDAVLDTLDAEGIDYVLSEEVSGREYGTVATFPLPANAVETVLDELRAVGIDDDTYTVVVEANTVISSRFEELQERYAENGNEDRIAREELVTAARSLLPDGVNYIILTIISAVVATAGLLLDSASVVVGSMVIAPLVGPALAASVGTVVDDGELRVRGVAMQALGVALAVASAAAFALLAQSVNLVPPGIELLESDQIRERFAPGILSLAIALGAGIAGALSLSTGVSAALVGVMIAVALIPPAAVTGIALAWGAPTLAAGSAVLLSVNILSINLAALSVLWVQGYRPQAWLKQREVMAATVVRIGVLAVVILFLSTFLAGVTYATYQGAVTEEQIHTEADAVVSAHEELELIDLTVQIDEHPLESSPESVVVTVGKPAEVPSPQLAQALAERIEAATDSTVTVQVRFVEIQRNERQ